jgi:membrane protein
MVAVARTVEVEAGTAMTDETTRAHRDAGKDRSAVGGPGSAGTHGPPDVPSELSLRSWWRVLVRTIREFDEDHLFDWAAALTYYTILSIFPGLLVLISVLGLLGQSAIQPLLENVRAVTPEPAREILEAGARSLTEAQGAAGVFVVLGAAGALWSASGYVAAFMSASNIIYDVREGRPLWKTLPIRLGVTVLIGVMLVVSVVIVIFTGRLAEAVGTALGAGSLLLSVWGIAKWPVLLVLVSLMLALLYWASPNARQGGFRWISPGGLLAVLVWMVASIGFGLYTNNFGSYNKTYGTLGGVILFFVWLWISNVAVLLGAQFDAELHRGRAVAAGQPEGQEPYVELREEPKTGKGQDSHLG